MPSFIYPILCAVLGYVAGSINWGYLVARWYGVDIQATGTRNPGAANVFRAVGRAQGIAVYLADVLTAALVIFLAGSLPESDFCRLAGAVMLLTGTIFPIFFGFKGGTGLAKGMGVVMGIHPAAFFLGVPVGLFVLWKYHNTGWAGALAVVTSLLFTLLMFDDYVGGGIMAMVAAVIFLRARIQYR